MYAQWIGGEQYSLNVPWPHQKEFSKAGYTPLVLSEPYTQSGGLVRQYGNFSFTRVSNCLPQAGLENASS